MTSTSLKVSEAASLAGVSDDTIRRWAESGRLDLIKGDSGPSLVEGAQLAHLLQELSSESPLAPTSRTSTRNRLVGIVTRVKTDGVMAQVDLQAGPFRIVSLISSEAVHELGIEVGTVAAATVKATSVSISLPERLQSETHAHRTHCRCGIRGPGPDGLLVGDSGRIPHPHSHSHESRRTLTGTITVLAASSLTKTFTTLAADFEAANPGVTVQTSFAGSGALVTQIQQGAPADIFAAAAAAPMATLQTGGQLEGSPTNFATNTLEIAVPPTNPAGIQTFADLAKPGVKLVICAPTEPCGASSVAMEKVENVTLTPVALEPAVANVLTAVSSGQADAGLVYKTDVLGAAGSVKGITFADSGKVVNTYPISVLKESKNQKVARAFVAFILAAKAQAVLATAGFGKP